MRKLDAYIDSFEYLTVLIDENYYSKRNKLFLFDGENKKALEVIDFYKEHDFYKYIVKNPGVLLNKDYEVGYSNGVKGILRSGSIIRDPRFDEIFKYDGPLGMEYSKKETIFRAWSPVAKEMYILVTKNDKEERFDLKYTEKGVWEVKLIGDYECAKYLIYVRVFDTFEKTLDPYALSSGANALYNYIVDKNKFYKMKYEKPHLTGMYTDNIIYEASVRDFTYYLNGESKGTFLGMVENHPTKTNEPTGLDYIKSLGVTHLQLLPTFDFEEVDDLKKNSLYNWGYNPHQYFVPCGWYSKNPDDPYSRINELMKLIDECHKRGLAVNMDVVFNHVYKVEEFPFESLVPGYAYRVDEFGHRSNASYCGNDFASERYMCRRFIIDVLEYYTSLFKVSGFRFDLMGLIDIDTMNEAYEKLSKIDSSIMMYGEGWNMDNPLPIDLRATMINHYKIPNYAFFNDRFREQIRGSQFDKIKGFVFDNDNDVFDAYHLALGSCLSYFKFNEPTQTINYVECHDNYTFYDFTKTGLGIKDEEEIKDAARLALSLVVISEGVPFIHGGEEFFRTKQGVENSYNTKDEVNKIDYDRRDANIDMVNTLRYLISIRKEYPCFRYSRASEIRKRIHPLEALIDKGSLAYIICEDDYNIIVLASNDYERRNIELENYKMIFDGYKCCDIEQDSYIVDKPGVYLFKGEKEKWI